MYTLVKTIAKAAGNESRWSEIDLSNVRMMDAFQNYRKVYAVLTHPTIQGEVTLDLESIRKQSSHLTITFSEFLLQNGNKNLPTVNVKPELKDQFVRYVDAFRAGYSVTPTHPSQTPNDSLTKADRTALYLSKEGLDFREFLKYCLVTVNGYFHFVDADKNGAWVIDGMKSNYISKENLIGIHSFYQLGSIKCKPIKKNMVFKLNSEDKYKHQMCIDIGENIDNKTVLLVLGGYLHVLDRRSFYQLNEKSILIKMNHLPLLERFHESQQYLDLEFLPHSRNSTNESMINVEDYLSDENLLAYATLSQSFVVLLDNKEVYTEKISVRNCPTPKLLISMVEPGYPLFHGVGKCADYWDRKSHGQWALYVDDNQWSRRFYETVNVGKIGAIGDSEKTQQPVEYGPAYFLKIGSDIKLN